MIFHIFFHQVVDLINQAQLYTKDNLKIENLKKVQELVIYKEPALLDNFLDVSLYPGFVFFIFLTCFNIYNVIKNNVINR